MSSSSRRTFAFSVRISSRSTVVTPSLWPWSTSSRRYQPRSVSFEIPSRELTAEQALVTEPYSCSSSRTNRNARFFSSDV